MKAQPVIREYPYEEDVDSMVRYIVKHKIKTISEFYYNSEDSTINIAKLSTKYKSIYDSEGNLLESTNENGTGKIIDKVVSKYDSKNNCTESIHYDSVNNVSSSEKTSYDYSKGIVETIYYDSFNKISSSRKTSYDYSNRIVETIAYDSGNKISSSRKTLYDDANRIVERSYFEPPRFYNSSYLKDDFTYTDRYKYDLNGNLIETTIDSSGVRRYKKVSKFDGKNRLVFSENYLYNTLQSTQTNIYDKKGAYTQIIEYYPSTKNTQCSSNITRTVTKFDTKGNAISSISTFDKNAEISGTKTKIIDYKYSNLGKLLSRSTTVEIKGEGFFSKLINSDTIYKYDTNGNEIEAITLGQYNAFFTTKTEYNSNNKITKQEFYKGNGPTSLSPIILSILINVYYPDGKTLMEVIEKDLEDYPTKYITKYNERSLQIERISIYTRGSSRTVYNYEYW